jgi:hypothetical protein
MQNIIYPTPPSECPSYLNNGTYKWAEDVRIANGFGKQVFYNIGDIVEYISFWYTTNNNNCQRNNVIIEKVKILSLKKYKFPPNNTNGDTYYGLEYMNGRGYNSSAPMCSLRAILN